MNFELEACIAGDTNNLVLSPKKLKTRPNDFANINRNKVEPVIQKEVIKEEPKEEPIRIEPEIEKTKEYSFDDYSNKPEPEEDRRASINIDEIIKSRIKEEKEEKPVEPEPMDDNIEFAYAGRIVEPEVSDEAITRIKSLGDDYKGEVHPKATATIKTSKEEPSYNENDYVRLLQTDCYSPRTKKYLDQRLEEYNNLVSEIENVKEQIEEITDKYKMESEIAAKLNSIKKETYGIMTWINSSDFKILKNEKTNAVNNLFKSYEELFNENQQKFKKADEELVKTNEISADLGKKEKEAREELTRLTKEKKSTIKEYYEKVEEVIELDENMKKQANEMAAITGIDDSEIINPRRENKFDSLRSDD